jgi:HEAT repeat protein
MEDSMNQLKKRLAAAAVLILITTSALTVTGKGTGTQSTLYPGTLDRLPPVSSPFTREDGMEVVTAFTKNNKYVLVPVTVTNCRSKGRQLDVDGDDFPTLAKTGLHSEAELRQAKTITGRSISEITAVGRPGQSSGVGFLAEDEDIISVLAGDNRLVKKLGLTHPQAARPLFHTWNMILKDLELNLWPNHKLWDNFRYILYNGKKVIATAVGTRGGQESIFDDEIEGAVTITIRREPDKEEKRFLAEKYAHLDEEQLKEMIKKLSTITTGEMEPYYIQRYGFYEGHTDYRTDPLAISFVFGLKRIEEIEQAFPGEIDKILRTHFTEPRFAPVVNRPIGQSGQSTSAPKEVETLIKKLSSRHWEVPARKLAKMGEPVVQSLIDTVNGKTGNRWIAERAAYALGGIDSKRGRDALIAVMRNPGAHVRVRGAAAEALGFIKSKAAVEPLLEVVTGKTVYPRGVRWNALRGLDRLGTQKAVDAFIGVLMGNDRWYFKSTAARGLGKIKSPKSIQALIHVFNDNNWKVWEEAGNALVQMGEPAVEPLIRALKSPHTRTRRKAAWTLGIIKSEKAVYPLINVLGDKEWLVREEAAVALSRINSPKALEPLKDAARSKVSEVREAAAWVLEKM